MIIDARVRLPHDRRPHQDTPPPERLVAGYQAALGVADTALAGVGELLAELELADACAVVHAEYEWGDPADALNEAVAELVTEHPGRLTGVGTVSQQRIEVPRALRQLDRIAELGLVGVSVQPAFFDMAIDDRRLYPVYAKALELDLVVFIHTGINYSRAHEMAGERPLLLDRVLVDLPDLRLVAGHASWPWTAELAAVARRHPNLMLDFGGLAPRYLTHPGAGWQPLSHLIDNVLRGQVLFASDWPVQPIAKGADEWRASGLREATVEAALSGNAQRLGLAPRHIGSAV